MTNERYRQDALNGRGEERKRQYHAENRVLKAICLPA